MLIFTSDDIRSLALVGAIRRTGLKTPVRQIACEKKGDHYFCAGMAFGSKLHLPNFGVCRAGTAIQEMPSKFVIPKTVKLSPDIRNVALTLAAQIADMIPGVGTSCVGAEASGELGGQYQSKVKAQGTWAGAGKFESRGGRARQP